MIRRSTLFAHILIFAVVALPGLGHADDSIEVTNKVYWICKNRKEVRTIRVHINDKSGLCSTVYSREGAEKMVGSGKNQESCMNFLNNIKTNLEKSNWACRDISSTKITAGLE